MNFRRKKHCIGRRTYSRRGYQGRFNFGIAKLNREDARRQDAITEMIGEDAYQELITPHDLTSDVLADTGYMTVIDKAFYCGQNFRLALLEYIDEKGRLSTRMIEYYSFRRTSAGYILLYGFSYKEPPGGIRSFRLDRIVSLTPTMIPFTPRWEVEIII